MKNAKKNAKWWAFGSLWIAVFALLMGAFLLGAFIWRGVQSDETALIVAGVLLGGFTIYLGVLQFIGYVQDLRYQDEEEEPVAQRPQREAKV